MTFKYALMNNLTESRGLLMPDLELVCHADANSLVTIKLKPSSSKIVETGLSSLKAKENFLQGPEVTVVTL